MPWVFSKETFEYAKVCSPEVQGSELVFHSPLCPQDPELHYLLVTAAKAVFDLHIPIEPLLVGEYELQQSFSSHWLLCRLEEEVIINALQVPRGLLVSCCVVLAADNRGVEVPYEGQGLQT